MVGGTRLTSAEEQIGVAGVLLGVVVRRLDGMIQGVVWRQGDRRGVLGVQLVNAQSVVVDIVVWIMVI
jgi:cbb3-type cytochrome oxidase subunit 1